MPTLLFTLLQCFLILILGYRRDIYAEHPVKNGLLFLAFSAIYIALENTLANRYVTDMLLMTALAGTFYALTLTAAPDYAFFLGLLYALCFETGKVIVYGPLALTPLMGTVQSTLFWHCVSRGVILAVRAGLLFAVRHFAAGDLENTKIPPALFLFMLLPLATLACMRVLVLPTYSASFQKFPYDQALILFLLGVSVIGTAGSGLFALTSANRRRRLEQIEQIIQMQYRIAEERERSDTAIVRMNHDMKNQLAGLSAVIDSEEGKEHLERLRSQLESYTIQDYTQDRILNALLNEKVHTAESRDIHIQVFMEAAPGQEISTEDLCSIFGNLLDNAIEAVAKLEKAQRFIIVKAVIVGKYWIMKITNPYTGELNLRDGTYLTTKENPAAHGIGLSSVRLSVSHYHGEMVSEGSDGMFTVTVMLPYGGTEQAL